MNKNVNSSLAPLLLRLLPSRTIVALALALALSAPFGVYRLMNARMFQVFGSLVAHVQTSSPLIALTFDDGPLREPLHQLLPMLAAYGAHATFFVEGRFLERDLALGRELLAAGHELGNHSYSHQRMVFKSQAFITDEIVRTDRAILAAGQREPIFFRPPFGKKLIGLPWYLAKHARTTIMWDIEPDSHTGNNETSSRLIEAGAERAKPGSIILLHVMQANRRASLGAVPFILSSLSTRGYRFVTVSELIASAKR